MTNKAKRKRKEMAKNTNILIAQKITEDVIDVIHRRMQVFQPSLNGKSEIYNAVLNVLKNGVEI